MSQLYRHEEPLAYGAFRSWWRPMRRTLKSRNYRERGDVHVRVHHGKPASNPTATIHPQNIFHTLRVQGWPGTDPLPWDETVAVTKEAHRLLAGLCRHIMHSSEPSIRQANLSPGRYMFTIWTSLLLVVWNISGPQRFRMSSADTTQDIVCNLNLFNLRLWMVV
jgi:hypothetical protein